MDDSKPSRDKKPDREQPQAGGRAAHHIVGEPFNPWWKICGFYPPDIVGADKALKLTDGQKRLYERAVRWAGRNGKFWHSFEEIAQALGKSERQVKADMAALEEKGLIGHTRRRRESNLYYFRWHAIFEVQPTAQQEPILEVQDTTLEVQDCVKKGPLKVQPTAQELCPKENYVQESCPSTSADRKTTGVVERRKNADARAPISQQVAVSQTPAVTILPGHGDPAFEEFMGVFLAAGKKLNERDIEKALRLWLNFEVPEHAVILEHLKRSVTDGTWSGPEYTPMPASYLASQAWTRRGPDRILPKPPRSESKAESAIRRAAERFRRGER
jgi:hypothetical protein